MDFFAQTNIHNRFRLGHSLMVGGVFLFLVFSLLLSTITSIPAVAFGSTTIFELTNQARTTNGLTEFELSEELTFAAQAKAEAMVENNYFEHTSPDGTTGWDYINDAGYEYTFAGENLAASNEDDTSYATGANASGPRDQYFRDRKGRREPRNANNASRRSAKSRRRQNHD
mgnify:CR=1 FL=1